MRLRSILVALLAALALVAPRHALAAEPQVAEARGAIVMDGGGQVLWELDAYRETNPASITKVMTAMVALDSGFPLDATITCVDVDLGDFSQTAGYVAGDKATLRDLLEVALVWSANDACYQIACGIAGSEEAFVALMNAKAQSLGMTHTHFENCHGLGGEQHYSCARDLALMGRYALANYPFIAQTVALERITTHVGKVELDLETTHKPISDYEGLLGIKTGSLLDDGSSFLGAAERDGMRVYTVVLDCPTLDGRFDDTRTLMDWAFANCTRIRLCEEGQLVRMAPFAFDARLVCPVTYQQRAEGVRVKGMGAVTFRTTRASAQHLVAADAAYGATLWMQGSRLVGASTMASGRPVMRPLAVNPFLLPLFGDGGQMGGSPWA